MKCCHYHLKLAVNFEINFKTQIDDLKKVRKDDRECYFSYYLNYAICLACAYMLNNGCDMDNDACLRIK